jgi:kynureninase
MSVDIHARARELDAQDPLASWREHFVIPDNELIYLDGNSLGRMPKKAISRVAEILDLEWADRLIRSWDETWLAMPETVGDLIGTNLLGANPGETLVCDTTTLNIFKLVHTALDLRPDRNEIVMDPHDFPTDRYVVEVLASQRGKRVHWIEREERTTDGVTGEEIANAVSADTAVVLLSMVDYRSAAIADVSAITGIAHAAGALMLWDASHAVGALPVDLHADDVDLAVGCSYKYLNGGPGAPAWLYVRQDLQAEAANPVAGWLGRQDAFDMGPGYQPAVGIRRYITGTVNPLGMALVEVGVNMLVTAGIADLRTKSMTLGDFVIECLDELLTPRGFTCGSPRDARLRGGHVTLRHPQARALTQQLISRDVVPDFRAPDGIRIGLAPITTRYTDVSNGLQRLQELVDQPMA